MVLDFIFGFLLIFSGRELFWLCVGVVGFLIGIEGALWWGYTSGWMTIVAALVLGFLGAVLAVSFEWITVVLGVGFLGGGYLLVKVSSSVFGQEQLVWPIFVVGGIIGTCLMIIIFDWTLIIFSSLLGAMFIAHIFQNDESLSGIIYISSVLAGILVQCFKFKAIGKGKRAVRSRSFQS